MKQEFGYFLKNAKFRAALGLTLLLSYGYAIANDVGSAIKGKTVDLYMEKFSQCVIWGARWTTVYVIE